MQLPFEQLIHATLGECYARRNTVFVMFVIISLSFLAVGSMWPKRYTSFTIIHADETNILQPLMHGTAETTRATNYTSNAKEIIFGEVIMNRVLSDAGWLKDNPSDVEQAQIKNGLKARVKIDSVGRNLIKISYRASLPLILFK